MDIDVRKTAQDAAYITVGVGVIAYQQAQARRREAQARFEAQARTAKAFFEDAAKDGKTKLELLAGDVRTKLDGTRTDLAGKVEPLFGDLIDRVEPIVEQVQSVPGQVRSAVEAGATRARELVSRAA